MLMNNSASMTRRCAIGLSAGVAALACFSSAKADEVQPAACLLYTSPSPRD